MSLIFELLFIIILLSLIWIFYLHFFVYGECKSKRRLDGKTVLITGANSGIGFETAKDLAKRGARVIITSENYIDCLRAKDELISITKNKEIIAKYLDLSILQNVREFAVDILATEEKIDILINNAGTAGYGVKQSKDGLLLGLQINYFGPFLLTHLLIDLLKKAPKARIVNTASTASQVGTALKLNKNKIIVDQCPENFLGEGKIYSLSKLYTVYMTWEMSSRLKEFGITVNCVHPGLVRTTIYNKTTYWNTVYGRIIICVLGLYMKSPRQGAQTTIHCAISEEAENITGKYFQDCKPFRPYIKKDYEIIQAVWDASIKAVKLQPDEIKM